MSSVSKFLGILMLGCATAAVASTGTAENSGTLRVCADPNNLPFSNRAQQGFENRLADMVAKDMNMQVSYFWFPQRKAFFRKTLNDGRCDVVMGVPVGIPVASTTTPYYRSTYVFVSRKDRHLNISSMDDPRLRILKIGVHITGDEDSNLPPVIALTSRGIVRNLVGYSIYGNLAEKNPPADLIEAVVHKQVDIAIVWGPLGGYFAKEASVPLRVTPVDVVSRNPAAPFTFAISMGVRHGDNRLQQELNTEIQRREPQIRHLLESYGVPLLAAPQVERAGY